MTIAFDASAEKETAAGPASPQTWTHTPVGTPKAAVIAIIQLAGTSSSTDYIASVAYGGASLTRARRAVDTAGAKGAADLWFLGSGLPTGAQTVEVEFNSPTTPRFHFVSLTFTGSGDIELVDSDSIDNNTATASVTLQYVNRTSMAIAAEFCGRGDLTDFTVNSGCTVVQSFFPSGTGVGSIVLRQTTAGSTDFAIGGTMALDDSAFAAIALSEVVVPVANTAVEGSATFSTGTETTGGTITIPVTTQAGDDIFVLVTSRDHNNSIAAPTCTDNDASSNTFALLNSTGERKGHRYWKKATANTAGKTVTISGAVGSCAGGLVTFRGGFEGGDPTTNLVSVADTDRSVGGFTPDFAGSEICLAIFNYTDDISVSTMSCTDPGLLTRRFQAASTGGGDCSVTLGSSNQSTGLTGTGALQWTQAAGTAYTMAWAVRPSTVTVPSAATSTLSNPVHVYGAAGTYIASLSVTDDIGNVSSTTTMAVTVAV